MKYIRTQDEKIYDTSNGNFGCDDNGNWYIRLNEEKPFICLNENEKQYIGKIIANKDTIEELCDEFVYKRVLSTDKVIYEIFERLDREHHADDEFCRLIEYRGNDYPYRQGIALEQVKNGVYGAIWTDKGLIYVAKMDEKGCLELL